MAIRTLDPVFWDDESIALLSRDARLLFICMVTDPSLTDDFGVLPANARTLRKHAFAFDDDVTPEQVGAWLNEMVMKCPNVVLFEVDGKPWLWLRNFEKFQNLRYHRKTTYPNPPDTSEISQKLPQTDNKFPMSSVVLGSIEQREIPGAREKNARADADFLPNAETQVAVLFAGAQATKDADTQLRQSGWNIQPDSVRKAACWFLQATGLPIPADKKARGDWYASLKVHVDNYGEAALADLYTAATKRFRNPEHPLTLSRPGGFDKTLPALIAEGKHGNGRDSPDADGVPNWAKEDWKPRIVKELD